MNLYFSSLMHKLLFKLFFKRVFTIFTESIAFYFGALRVILICFATFYFT